jgi:hypothetical protein
MEEILRRLEQWARRQLKRVEGTSDQAKFENFLFQLGWLRKKVHERDRDGEAKTGFWQDVARLVIVAMELGLTDERYDEGADNLVGRRGNPRRAQSKGP